MDGAHIAAASPEASGASSSASSASSYGGSASRRFRLQKGVHLRRRRRVAVRGGSNKGACDDDVHELALPLGMSFAAVLAQVINRFSGSEGRLQPDFLSEMCTSAVKESLTNIYGDKFQSFMSNFEKSFGSTLRTLNLINRTPIYKQDIAQCSDIDGNSVPEIKLNDPDSQSQIDAQNDMPLSSMDSQIVLHMGFNHQLVHLTRSRSTSETDHHISSLLERSLSEQARSNELKEIEIRLAVAKLQLDESQFALRSDSHMLEKIKIGMGFEKASFKAAKFKTQMEDTRHGELFRKLIDMLLTAVLLMSLCFGYGTYIYSYQRITSTTSACATTSREYTSWWMPSSVSAFNSGFLLFKCNMILVTRLSFGFLMIILVLWLIFQRSAMTGPNMPITFNVVLLGGVCGFLGSRCVDILGGDGNVWFWFWEALCSIHLLGNTWPTLLHGMLYGPVSVTDRTKAVHLPYWARRYAFYVLVSLILPCLAGLLPFASLSDWKGHAVQYVTFRFSESNIAN